MDAMSKTDTPEKGWFRNILGEDIRVVDADIIDRLDRIEAYAKAGRIERVKTEIQYLPESTRPVIEPWLQQYEE